MTAGILLALWAGGPLASPAGLACLCGLLGVSLPMALRPPSAFPESLRLPALAICWLLAGMIAGGWQLMNLPDAIPGDGTRADVSGMIRKVDGRLDGRLRIWLEVDRVHRGNSMIEGKVLRLSLAPEAPLPRAGTRLRTTARIYPPQGHVLHGAPDHSRRALAAGVVASGYVISRRPAVALPPDDLDWRVRLAAFRQRRADEIAAGMDRPAGGIAAALLIGDRRHVEQPVYDLFRSSGLAHLLAISGLHMGLLCFGAVGFVRAAAALLPGYASRFAAHKLAACVGMVAGFAYLLLSGMSVSAVRAWLMAMLVLAAWLLDRLGLTLRNVGIAAFIVLLVSPLSLFTAGMQLSFAATAALVIWFEGRRHAREGRSRPVRWLRDLTAASLVAGGATMPLTAYHFGAVAPWGVLANLIGIPLTGLLVMPAGMAVLVTGALPGPQVIDDAALLAMQFAIDALLAVTGWFAGLPASPWRVAPPPPLLLSLLYGGMAMALCLDMSATARKPTLSAIAVAALAAALLSPAPDGVYYARRAGGHLLLAGAMGQADTIMAGGPGLARSLSPYLADNAARPLAQSVHTDGGPANGGSAGMRLHGRAAGGTLAIVTLRRRLTAGCWAGAAMVIATVSADYPCRDGTPLVSLSGLPAGNYTLRITNGGITARAADGQYFRISPVSRP
ncbi:MAG: ComEC/Rec2 family competence protein [Pseudomonadota bacterium]|nr:ComEC/Rec2 family competence protein [Pseudomonadota bacterium]MEC8268681.1 ComEC/Rec2 family competence protein [Pseudomonadota bacterium]